MIDATPSYRCRVSDGNTLASLFLGKRCFKADVLEMSRDSFRVRVPARIAQRVSVGGKNRLLYQEMLWSVRCTHKWMGEGNLVDLDFQHLEELTPPKLNRGLITVGSKQIASGGQTDPTLPAAALGAFILAILIMPAWGGHWGTSDLICSAVSNTWSVFKGLVTGQQ